MKQVLKQLKVKWDVWSLHYREYIVGFIIGVVVGAIIF
jgi:Mg/Co/Ni transporter MgtE